MLVLSRKKNEDIVMPTTDGQIVVRLLEIRGENVRLGIEAPREIEIFRGELLEDAKQS